MKRLTLAAVLLVVLGAGFGGSLDAKSEPAQSQSAPIVVLHSPDVPVTIDAARVVADPAGVAFTATNTTPKQVRAYSVTVFVYPPAGQRHGFVNAEQTPPRGLTQGQADKATMTLANRTLGPDTTLVLAVKNVAFEDGTEWSAPDLPARVDQKVQSLK